MVARRRVLLGFLLLPLGLMGAFMLAEQQVAVAAPPVSALPPDNVTREYVMALVEPMVQSAALPDDPPADAAAAMARAHALEAAQGESKKKFGALLNQWAGFDAYNNLRTDQKAYGALENFVDLIRQQMAATGAGTPSPADPLVASAVALTKTTKQTQIQLSRLILFAARKGDPEAQYLAGKSDVGGFLLAPFMDLGVRPANRIGIQAFWQSYWLTKAAQGGWRAAQLALGKIEAMNRVMPWNGADKNDTSVHQLLFDCPGFPAVPASATENNIRAYPESYNSGVRQWSAACRARGREWLTKAVVDHDPEAELALAQAYENESNQVSVSGIIDLQQTTSQKQQAFVWYRKAVLDGSRDAALRLMQVYEAGDEGMYRMNGIPGVHKDLQAAQAMAKLALDLTPTGWDRKSLELKLAELTKQAKEQAQLDHDAAETFGELAAAINAALHEGERERAEWQRKPVVYRHNACVSACSSRHNSCVSSNNSNAMWAHLGAAWGSPMVAGLAAGAIRNCSVSDSMCIPSCMDSGP